MAGDMEFLSLLDVLDRPEDKLLDSDLPALVDDGPALRYGVRLVLLIPLLVAELDLSLDPLRPAELTGWQMSIFLPEVVPLILLGEDIAASSILPMV
jgi:hypothetical protein